MKRILTTLGLALAFTGGARAAGFSPVAIDPSSFNHDVVIEAAAARSLNDVVNATMDGGTNKSGNTFYERGYDPLFPNTGLPVAGSTITTNSHTYQMPPDYHVNNVLMVGHNNGGRTPV